MTVSSTSGAPRLQVIEPPRRREPIALRELWAFRELLVALTLRDVKVRYKQTALGVVWAVLQPLLGMVVFSVFLGRLAGVPSDGLPYPVFSYSGLIVWLYFASALDRAGRSLVANGALVAKVYFARLVAPLSGVLSPLLDFLAAFAILLVIMAGYGLAPPPSALLVPVLVIPAVLAAAAFGIWLAALNVEYRDVGHAIPMVIQLWLFVTPVAYPASLVEGGWRIVYALNPMAGVVTSFRWAITGTDVEWTMLATSTLVSIAALVTGLFYFRRVERTFADAI